MPVKVLMISRDATALNPESDTARRLRLYGQKGAELQVAVFAKARQSTVNLSESVTVYGFSGGIIRQAFSILLLGRRLVRQDWVVTSQDPFEAGLLAWRIARRVGAALELQLHGDFFGSYWEREAWHRSPRLLYARWLLGRADVVRVTSQRLAHSVSEFVSYSCIAVIPVPARNIKLQSRDESSPLVSILYAGRLSKEKNLPLLISAFKKVQDKHSNTTLHIIGSGPEEDKLKKIALELNIDKAIHQASWQSDLILSSPGRIICAVTSNHESWNRFVVEAALTGCPIVMTDVGCAGELIKNGKSGWVVPVGDAEAFAAALEEAIENPEMAKVFADNAKKAAEELPSADQAATMIVQIWQRLSEHRAVEE